MDVAWEELSEVAPTSVAEGITNVRASQILAEMLGMVCHQEYIDYDQDQTVRTHLHFLYCRADSQAFVIHFDGFKAAIYFATFSAKYLRTIRSTDLAIVQKWDKTSLNRTKLYDLYDADDRTDFIRELVALLRFVSCDEANIGHLRKNGTQIHRMMGKTEEVEDEAILGPPQWELDNNEQLSWAESEVYGT